MGIDTIIGLKIYKFYVLIVIVLNLLIAEGKNARVLKLVDRQHLKCCEGNFVPVRFRPRAQNGLRYAQSETHGCLAFRFVHRSQCNSEELHARWRLDKIFTTVEILVGAKTLYYAVRRKARHTGVSRSVLCAGAHGLRH